MSSFGQGSLFRQGVIVSAGCPRLGKVFLFWVGCSCLLRAKRLAVSAPREQRHQCKRRLLLAKTKLLSSRNNIGVLSTESILSTNTWWDIINRHRDKQFSVSKAQALRRARWGGSLALELLRLAVLSGQTTLSVDETSLRCFSSGQNGFSPDETAL